MKKKMMFLLGACLSLGLVTAANAETYSTSTFSVEVPEEAIAIADIEVEEDGIRFYESLAHESHMGYVATIKLFEKEEDYLYIPNYKWVGAVITADGQEKQVVLDRPSDVQVDFEKPGSIDNYHTLTDLVENTIVPSLTVTDGKYLAPDQVNHRDVYNATIEQLKQLIEAKASTEELEAAGFSYQYALLYDNQEGLDQLYVAYADIGKTGFPEMAITAMDGSVIYDLFTQKQGEVLHVLSGGERDIFTFCGYNEVPNNIAEVASGSAFYTEFNFYAIDSITKELYQTISCIYDEKAEDGPYLIRYFSDEEPEAVSEEEWLMFQSNHGETVIVPHTPLFESGEEVAVG